MWTRKSVDKIKHNANCVINQTNKVLTKTVINRDLSEFILKDGNLPFVLLLENVVHEGSLSSSEEPSNHCDGCQSVLVGCHLDAVCGIQVVGLLWSFSLVRRCEGTIDVLEDSLFVVATFERAASEPPAVSVFIPILSDVMGRSATSDTQKFIVKKRTTIAFFLQMQFVGTLD